MVDHRYRRDTMNPEKTALTEKFGDRNIFLSEIFLSRLLPGPALHPLSSTIHPRLRLGFLSRPRMHLFLFWMTRWYFGNKPRFRGLRSARGARHLDPFRLGDADSGRWDDRRGVSGADWLSNGPRL